MKKYLMILVAFIGLGISANAQTAECKITNPTEPNATVVGSVVSTDDDGKVNLTFSSDESRKFVNITFSVFYNTPNGGGSKLGTANVAPNQSVPAFVNIGKGNKVSGLSISGARCEK
jgi:hypothetical protein